MTQNPKAAYSPEVVISLFEHSWSEVDWILPVLCEIKSIRPEWKLIAVFSPGWRKKNPDSLGSTLQSELEAIADDLVHLSQSEIVIPGIAHENQVRLIFKNLSSEDISDTADRLRQTFPSAKIVAHPHGQALEYLQRWNKVRNFNWWDEYYSFHDLMYVDHSLSVPRFFDRYLNLKICITGIPRLDISWRERLITGEKFLNSPEKKMAQNFEKVFLFIARNSDLGFFGFDYVTESVADAVLTDPETCLLIKPHPNQDLPLLSKAFENYDNSRFIISNLHTIQLAHLADIVISVTTTSILDVLRLEKPVIEFHPKPRPFMYFTADNQGNTKSQYDLFDIVYSVNNKDELKYWIDNLSKDYKALSSWKIKRRNFDYFFPKSHNASRIAANAALALVEDGASNNAHSDIFYSWTPVSGGQDFIYHNSDSISSEGRYDLNFSIKRVKTYAMPLSTIVISELNNIFTFSTLVVTGTFSEHFVKEACDIIPEVHVIESASDLYQPQAFNYFSGCNNLEIYNSSNILRLLLSKLKGRGLFILGSHDASHATHKSKTHTPVIEELRVLKDLNITDSVIIIRDLRYFQPTVLCLDGIEAIRNRRYPSIHRALEIIYSINTNYQFYVLGDIGIAHPEMDAINVTDGVKALTLSRLNNFVQDCDKAVAADLTIAHSLPDGEKNTVKSLHKDYFSFEEPGVGAHYYYWDGLTLLGDERFSEAEKQFIKAIELGYDPWHMLLVISRFADRFSEVLSLQHILVEKFPEKLLTPIEYVNGVAYQAHGRPMKEINFEFIGSLDRSTKILEIGTNKISQLPMLYEMGFSDLNGVAVFNLDADSQYLPSQEPEKEIYQFKTGNLDFSAGISYGSPFHLPYEDNSFDLAYTTLFLRHFDPDSLQHLLKELCRCSRRFIWGFEYYNDEIVSIPSDSEKDIQWKGNYVQEYLKINANLRLIKEMKYKYVNGKNRNCMFLLSQ